MPDLKRLSDERIASEFQEDLDEMQETFQRYEQEKENLNEDIREVFRSSEINVGRRSLREWECILYGLAILDSTIDQAEELNQNLEDVVGVEPSSIEKLYNELSALNLRSAIQFDLGKFSHIAVKRMLNDSNVAEYLVHHGQFSILERFGGHLREIYWGTAVNEALRKFTKLTSTTGSGQRSASMGKSFPLTMLLFAFYPSIFFVGSRGDAISFHSGVSDEASEWENSQSQWKPSETIEGLSNIVGYLDSFEHYHPFMFAQKGWYRDHLQHTIRVIWLIEKLASEWSHIYEKSVENRADRYLDRRWNLSSNSQDQVINGLTSGGGKNRLVNNARRQSIIAAAFHDIMYPLEGFFEGNPGSLSHHLHELIQISELALPFFDNQFIETDFVPNLLDVINTGSNQIKASNVPQDTDIYPDNYTHEFVNHPYNHGILASVALEDLPQEARQAMAVHDSDIDVKISPLENPIGFFLILCDEAQEWGRLAPADLAGQYYEPLPGIEYHLDKHEFVIHADYSGKKEEIERHQREFDIEVPVENKSESLRRLDVPKQFDLNIQFKFTGPEGNKWLVESPKWIPEQV